MSSKSAVSRPRRLRGDQHVVTGLAGRRLDPGRDVDGVADDAEVEPPAAADRARDDLPGVDADPDPEAPRPAVAVDRAAISQRGADSPVGVVGVGLRRPEHGQQPVALELVDVAAVAGDHRHDDLEQRVEAGDDLGGARLRGEAR